MLLSLLILCTYTCRCECYDYLFDVATQMKQCGLDPAQQPSDQPQLDNQV